MTDRQRLDRRVTHEAPATARAQLRWRQGHRRHRRGGGAGRHPVPRPGLERADQAGRAPATTRACPPAAQAVSFSDALDKLVYDGIKLGGLSSLAYDPRSAAWVSAVDNNATDPARIWFFRNLSDPKVIRDPLVLRQPDGTPYNGTNSDNEGLAVLPNGDYLVSSETEPSVRIYNRQGLQVASLPVPARFAVTGTTPVGQATSNATLEGLTISRSGREIVAAMEGALSGDVSAAGVATLHRFLVYDVDSHGAWKLTRQIAYRTEAGNRIPEVAAYGKDSLLVEEAAFSATAGNSEELYAVRNVDSAPDVSAVANLSAAPARDVVQQEAGGQPGRLPDARRPVTGDPGQPAAGQLRGDGHHRRRPRRGRREHDQRRQLQRHPVHPGAEPPGQAAVTAPAAGPRGQRPPGPSQAPQPAISVSSTGRGASSSSATRAAAPLIPASRPSDARAMRSCPAASGRARAYTSCRMPAR